MKCRLCSSGLYICMTAPLLTRDCSSAVRVSGLLESSGMKAAVIISKTLNCALLVLTNDFLIESIRGSAEFLSDHFEHYARRFRGCVATVDSGGGTIWIADAHRGDGKRFVVRR